MAIILLLYLIQLYFSTNICMLVWWTWDE